MNPLAKTLARHVGGFLATVVAIVALGAVLGAIIFPLAGRLGGAHKTAPELALFGAKTLGFYFFVWAPGIALVREVMRAAETMREKPSSAGIGARIGPTENSP